MVKGAATLTEKYGESWPTDQLGWEVQGTRRVMMNMEIMRRQEELKQEAREQRRAEAEARQAVDEVEREQTAKQAQANSELAAMRERGAIESDGSS